MAPRRTTAQSRRLRHLDLPGSRTGLERPYPLDVFSRWRTRGPYSDAPDLGGFTAPSWTGRPHYGPGNVVSAEPIGGADDAYREHDINYANLGRGAFSGVFSPLKYFVFNSADATLLERIKDSNHPADLAARAFFTAKSVLSGKYGFVHESIYNAAKNAVSFFGRNPVGVISRTTPLSPPGGAPVEAVAPRAPRKPIPVDDGEGSVPRRPRLPKPADFDPSGRGVARDLFPGGGGNIRGDISYEQL